MLYDKSLDEINVLKMEILEVMIENENTEKEIKQWTENHKAAVASDLQCINWREQNRYIEEREGS